MKKRPVLPAMLAAMMTFGLAGEARSAGIEDISTIVVIYAENRSFDSLYGSFPGAIGLSQVTPEGYTQLDRGDHHIADIIAHLQQGPQWPHMLIVVSYDENGGFWDHVGPPKGDRWGPGSRIATLIVSPYARRGFLDHTLYDTTSILRFITKHYGLPTLAGLKARDTALAANGSPPLGDLTDALNLRRDDPP